MYFSSIEKTCEHSVLNSSWKATLLGSVRLCYSAGFNSYKSVMKQYFSRTTNQPYKSAEADLIPAEQSRHYTREVVVM